MADTETQDLSLEDQEAAASLERSERARKYLEKIQAREKEFETKWWKKGDDALKMYCLDERGLSDADNPYNILYSNTEVLAPSLYSATPKPDVRKRFKSEEEGPIPVMIERFLEAATDSAAPNADSFTGSMEDAVLSALAPGAGTVRLRYSENAPFPISFESIFFKNFTWGKARRWAKVPWISFKYELSKEAFGKKFNLDPEDLDEHYSSESDSEKDGDCVVYEFWHKESRKVWFISEEWGPKAVDVQDDPFQLMEFFPTPGPLTLTKKPGSTIPTPLYEYYRNQAEELNRVTVRLNKVLSAIRVRGVYNGLLGTDLQNILNDSALENGLVESANPGMLSQSGGFDKNIWLLPIEKLVQVAQQLYTAREAIKQVIYELTGISDIIRGSSVASETATAQDLKAKWGTVRLRKMQTIVANYVRDLFRLTIDCASTVVPAEQWKKIVQMPMLLEQEKMIAQQQAQVDAQRSQMMGQPSPPPNPALQMPSFEQLLKEISEDASRTFQIDIETSSTIDIDTAEDKAEVAEFMNALAQLMGTLMPLVQMGPSGVAAAKAILIAVCQRYKFGLSIVDKIKLLEAPPPPPPEQKGAPPPSPEQLELEKLQITTKLQETRVKAQAEQQRLQMEMQIAQQEGQVRMAELAAQRETIAINLQIAQLKLAQERAKPPSAPRNKNAPVSNPV